jgi:Flp pilus assembly protein TadG
MRALLLSRGQGLVACRRGATAVEFALLLPVLLLVLLGGMEFARIAWTVSTLNFAVQEAARCGAIGACADAAAVQGRAVERAWGLKIPAAAFTVTQPACGWNVAASIAYAPMLTKVTPVPLTLAAQACKS